MLCHSLSPAARHFTSPDHNHTYLCHTLLILFTPLTPVSGLVATRTKFMTKTASSAIHSLFPGFRLLVISLYDFLVYWLLSQQDSLSIAFHVSESHASWIPRLRFPASVLTTPGLPGHCCPSECRVFQFRTLTVISQS